MSYGRCSQWQMRRSWSRLRATKSPAQSGPRAQDTLMRSWPCKVGRPVTWRPVTGHIALTQSALPKGRPDAPLTAQTVTMEAARRECPLSCAPTPEDLLGIQIPRCYPKSLESAHPGMGQVMFCVCNKPWGHCFDKNIHVGNPLREKKI